MRTRRYVGEALSDQEMQALLCSISGHTFWDISDNDTVTCRKCGHSEPLDAVAYEPLQPIPDHMELAEYQWLKRGAKGKIT